jgi:ubiquinone/menaquinone biosynthesis C-methylase UbiE
MNKEIDIWTDLAELVEDQLNLQVKMQFKHHHQFMLNNGLDKCSNVMDIGTGNGAFLTELAKIHPDVSFIGIDNQQQMVDRASNVPMKNARYLVGDVNNPDTIPEISDVDAVLMRYVLLHLNDTADVIHKLAKALKKSARLWIIDLDLESYTCRPQHEAFDLIKGLVKKFCDVHGRDSNIGSRLVELLKTAGFKSVKQEIEPLNTDTIDIPLLQRFIMQEVIAYQAALQNILTEEEFNKIKRFVDELPTSGVFLNYGVTLVSAVKR